MAKNRKALWMVGVPFVFVLGLWSCGGSDSKPDTSFKYSSYVSTQAPPPAQSNSQALAGPTGGPIAQSASAPSSVPPSPGMTALQQPLRQIEKPRGVWEYAIRQWVLVNGTIERECYSFKPTRDEQGLRPVPVAKVKLEKCEPFRCCEALADGMGVVSTYYLTEVVDEDGRSSLKAQPFGESETVSAPQCQNRCR